MKPPRAAYTLLLVAFAPACAPNPDDPRPPRQAPSPTPSILLSPPLDNGLARTVLRITVIDNAASSDKQPRLLKGELTAKELKDLAANPTTKTSIERTIRASIYADSEQHVVLVPQAPLEANQTYTVLFASQALGESFRTVAQPDIPHLARIWPPPSLASRSPLAAYCAAAGAIPSPLPIEPQSQRLEPSGLDAELGVGALPQLLDGCIHLRFRPSNAGSFLLPPLHIETTKGDTLSLDPSPILLGDCEAVRAPTGCPQNYPITTAQACIQASDDRIRIRSRVGPMLLGVAHEQGTVAARIDDDNLLSIRNLQPATAYRLAMQEIGLDGRWLRESVQLTTKAEDCHFVLNEVMSNPTGKEPEQEWIELYNDGSRLCNLKGHRVGDSQVESELPEVPVAGRTFALLVGAGFRLDAMERQPPPNTTIIELKTLGKGGISNAGEVVRLLGANSAMVSSVPAMAVSKQGYSIERTRLEAPDETPSAFQNVTRGGSPGLPNIHSN